MSKHTNTGTNTQTQTDRRQESVIPSSHRPYTSACSDASLLWAGCNYKISGLWLALGCSQQEQIAPGKQEAVLPHVTQVCCCCSHASNAGHTLRQSSCHLSCPAVPTCRWLCWALYKLAGTWCDCNIAHQSKCGQDILVIAHQVHLADGGKGLLLSNLGGACGQAQALTANTDCSTAHNDHIVAWRS